MWMNVYERACQIGGTVLAQDALHGRFVRPLRLALDAPDHEHQLRSIASGFAVS